METLGKRISALRREKDLTQDDVAERLGVSPQAVSKWENDQTCPDITLLPGLAKLLGVSVDRLLTGESDEKQPEVRLLPEEEKKNIEDMIFKVEIDSADGDRVRVNLPMGLVMAGFEMGVMPSVGINGDSLKNIDFPKIFEAAKNGAVGNLVDIESDGDVVRVFIE